MSTLPEKTVLITGANAGIGKEVARQLALRPEVARIYLACRNAERAKAAKAELEAATGRTIFEIVLMDVADLASVRPGLAEISGSVDALVMNAGVIGPQTLNLTADGVTTVFATNVLGHVVLLEGLLAEDRLGEVAVFAGSEAVRGVPKLRMKGPSFVSTSPDELASVIDGSYCATTNLTSTWLSGRPSTSARYGWATGPPTPRPPLPHREPRQYHRHPSSQWPPIADACSGQVRHAHPGSRPQT